MDFNIPLRPKNFDNTAIRKAAADCLTYVVLYGCKNEDAFARFNPEYLDLSGKLNKAGKDASRQFFAYAKHRQYIDDYKETLAEFLGRKSAPKSEVIGEIDESRKDKALKSLLNQAMSLVEGSGDLDAETLKIAAEIFKKVGLLKDEVEQQVRPLRFLPERCFSGCRYRLFVENAVKGGNLVDECKFCRALRYATENGYRDDASNRLDIPKGILDKEPDNTVSTLDILSGKIDN